MGENDALVLGEEALLHLSSCSNAEVQFRKFKSAWDGGNFSEFQNIFSADMDRSMVESFIKYMLKTTSDENFKSHRQVFWENIFEKHVHRKTFQNGTSLVRYLVEQGASEVLRLLLKHEPNLRQTAEDGDSSLHYLCKLDWAKAKATSQGPFGECMDLLLGCEEIDVNNQNDNGQTPLEVAVESAYSCSDGLLVVSKCKISDAIVKLLMNENVYVDKDLALSLNRNEVYKSLILKRRNNDSVMIPSRLRWWLRKKDSESFAEEFRSAVKQAKLPNNKLLLITFLQEATKRGMEDTVQLLLEYGASPSGEDKWNDSRSAIMVAIEYDQKKILKMLLERDQLMNMKWGHAKKRLSEINSQDPETGDTALHLAVRYGNENAMLKILREGGFVGIKNKKGDIPLTRIPAQVLEKFLNRQVRKYADDKGTVHFEFDCNFLRGDPNGRNTYPSVLLLTKIKENRKQTDLLQHPVLASFIMEKWEKLENIYYFNLLFYLSLLGCIMFNTLWQSTYNEQYSFFLILQSVLLAGLFVREVTQLSFQGSKYFKYGENYVEWSLIIIGCLYVYGMFACPDSTCSFSRSLGALLVLDANMVLLLMLGKHPRLSEQLEMFRIVCYRFMQFAVVYIIILLGFSATFFILFHECEEPCPTGFNQFSVVSGSFFKTMVMASGEFETNEMPFFVYPVTSHIIFILFVFLVAIALFNLLNGIAVYDLQKIKERAIYHTYKKRVEFLSTVDEFFSMMSSRCEFFKNYSTNMDNFVVSLKADADAEDEKSIICSSGILTKIKKQLKKQLKTAQSDDIVKRANIILEKREQIEKSIVEKLKAQRMEDSQNMTNIETKKIEELPKVVISRQTKDQSSSTSDLLERSASVVGLV